ncbi:hypothetical protein ETC05_05610 [Geobacillus sp. BMUD]|nr:hypothetical protein [Geobacillus sp. BMUD]
MSGPRSTNAPRSSGRQSEGRRQTVKTPRGHGQALSTPDAPLAKPRPKEGKGNGRHGRRQNKEEHE